MPAGYPTARPLQMLDFRNQAKVDSRFNFTRSTIGSYVNASGSQRIAAAHEPRPSYDPLTGAYQGLLMESPSTNLLPWSNNITASGWYYAPQNGAVSSGYTGIGGLPTAYRIAEGSVPGSWFVANSIVISGNMDYAVSAFVKSDGVSRGYLQFVGLDASGVVKGNVVVYFDLQRHLVFPENYAVNTKAALLEKRKNGWFRVGALGPMASGAALGVLNLALQRDDGSLFYQGAGRGLLTDGFQVEANVPNTYVSSFIPTSGVAATRASDFIDSKDGEFGNWYVNSGVTLQQEQMVLNDDFYQSGRSIFYVTSTSDPSRITLRLGATDNGMRLTAGVVDSTDTGVSVGSFVVGNGLSPWENPASGTGSSRPVISNSAANFSASGFSLVTSGQVFTTSGFLPSGIGRAIITLNAGKMILRRATIYPLLTNTEALLITQ